MLKERAITLSSAQIDVLERIERHTENGIHPRAYWFNIATVRVLVRKKLITEPHYTVSMGSVTELTEKGAEWLKNRR
jgi:hypothetical protein